MRSIDRFLQRSKKIYNAQDVLKNHFLKRYPIVHSRNQIEKYANEHDFVWLVDPSIKTLRTFPWHFNPTEKDAVYLFPYVYQKSRRVKSWDKVQLIPTRVDNPKTIKQNHICGEYDVYKGKDSFDIFFIGNKETEAWEDLKNRFPKSIAVDSYQEAADLSDTDMFWIVWDDLIIDDNFNFDYQPDEWSFEYPHVFGNNNLDHFNGIALMPKNYVPTNKELEYRFFASKKQIKQIASRTRNYEIFTIDSYDDYKTALEKTKTPMFWGIPSDVVVNSDFNFNLTFDINNKYDRNITHVFKNGDCYDGIALFSKNIELTKKEIDHRFYATKKEHDVVASTPKLYDKFIIDNYDDYLSAKSKSSTDMFWGIPNDVVVDPKFNFDLIFKIDNQFDRNITHVFKNSDYYDGIVLFSKNVELTKKEIDYRKYRTQKEHDVVASTPKLYDKFIIDNYDDYLSAKSKSSTDMFWGIPSTVSVVEDFKFDVHFNYHNQFDRNITHVFLNNKTYDGIALFSKNIELTKKEIDHRFYATKKEHDIVASIPKIYDIVFISNGEKYADKNYEILKSRFSEAKRILNVKGIHQAHIAAAKLCKTEMFWVVDGDAEIIKEFNFDYYIPAINLEDKQTVHVWKALNPINNLIYGYGAVKLLPRQLTIDMDTSKPDMTTSISTLFKIINRVSNITRFNTDEFSTWRSAFRECVKLSSKTIQGQKDEETEFRLNAWCTRGKEKEFGEACIAGAIAGREYGSTHIENLEALKMINDFEWLEQQFKQSYQST